MSGLAVNGADQDGKHTASAHSTVARVTCRPGCGACCTAPSISSPIVGMPHGKPAGVPCVQLGPQRQCLLFGLPQRPAVCGQLQPSADMCGPRDDAGIHAMRYLTQLERDTLPSPLLLR